MEYVYVDALPSDEESCYYAEHVEFRPEAEFSDDELAAVLPHCPNLTSAYLGGIRDLSSRTLILLAENAPNLTLLDICGCVDITDLGLQAVAAHSISLSVLGISRISGVTDPGLATLVRGLPRLEVLEMDNLPLVTAVSIRDVWTFARGLKRWSVSGCMHLTDAGFPWVSVSVSVSVSESGQTPRLNDAGKEGRSSSERQETWMETLPPLVLPATHTLKELRVLDLSHCIRITDTAVVGVVTHAPRIHQLSLAGCIELTDEALDAVCALGSRLHIIDIGGLERVTDRGVFGLASACSSLESVDISYIPSLTDLVVLELASLPRLQRLGAAGLPRLTDHAAFFVAEHAGELEQLHLTYCVGLTLDGVRAMLRRLAKLEYLSLSGVGAMRRRGVGRFSERPPEGYDERKQGVYRVFREENVRGLHAFLEKEEWRRREAERANIPFEPRGDDSRALY